MPRYENPSVPHDVNVGKTSAISEFFKLAAALVVFCVVLVTAVTFGMRFLVPYIPFRYELSLAETWTEKFDDAGASSLTRQYLQKLTERLAAQMDLPSDMSLTVHLSTAEMPNAFATFGGHIIITQGLLDLVDSENALAMVIAHEIGHIKHRDPIAAAGSGVALSIVMGVLFGNNDLAVISDTSGLLTQLTFSRAQESAADQAALAALTRYYGHTRGAETFFKKMLEKHRDDHTPPEFLSSHPGTEKRLAQIENDHTHQPEIKLTPLPEFLAGKRNAPSAQADPDESSEPE